MCSTYCWNAIQHNEQLFPLPYIRTVSLLSGLMWHMEISVKLRLNLSTYLYNKYFISFTLKLISHIVIKLYTARDTIGRHRQYLLLGISLPAHFRLDGQWNDPYSVLIILYVCIGASSRFILNCVARGQYKRHSIIWWLYSLYSRHIGLECVYLIVKNKSTI